MSTIKSKIRNAIQRKSKADNYDADLSMDSLNSAVPLRVNEHGRIIVQMNKSNNNLRVKDDFKTDDEDKRVDSNTKNKLNLWCEHEILSELASLKNVRTMHNILLNNIEINIMSINVLKILVGFIGETT